MVEESMWVPLRKAASEIIKTSPRLRETYEQLKGKNLPGLKLKLEEKKKIRDDVYDSFQNSNPKVAWAYALANLKNLEVYTKEELDWISEWREALINSTYDMIEEGEGSDQDNYPKIQSFWDIEDLDWVCFYIIRGTVPEDLPLETCFSAVLDQLTLIRREKEKSDKIKYIQKFLKDNPEAGFALEGKGSMEILTKLDTTKAQQFELRSYWLNHIQTPKLIRKAAGVTLKNFRDTNQEEPTLLHNLKAHIPTEVDGVPTEPFKGSILQEARTRIKDKAIRKAFRETQNANE